MRCVRLCFISIYVYMNIKCLDTLLVVYTGAYRMLYICMCIYIYSVYCITVNRHCHCTNNPLFFTWILCCCLFLRADDVRTDENPFYVCSFSESVRTIGRRKTSRAAVAPTPDTRHTGNFTLLLLENKIKRSHPAEVGGGASIIHRRSNRKRERERARERKRVTAIDRSWWL